MKNIYIFKTNYTFISKFVNLQLYYYCIETIKYLIDKMKSKL